MIMSSTRKNYDHNDCRICINGHELECVNKTTFLGVMIDNHLTWKSHIDYIYKSKNM